MKAILLLLFSLASLATAQSSFPPNSSGGGSVSLTGGTGISVSPDPITGTGVITNTAPGASPAGSAFQEQFNAGGGLFGASSSFSTDLTSLKLVAQSGGTTGLPVAGGSYTGYPSTPGSLFYIVVTSLVGADGTAPSAFKWQKNGGSFTTGVAVTNVAQALSDGVTINWSLVTGAHVNNSFSIQAGLNYNFGFVPISPDTSPFYLHVPVNPGPASFWFSNHLQDEVNFFAADPGGTIGTDITNSFAGVTLNFAGARGSFASPAALANGDLIQIFQYQGWDGVEFDFIGYENIIVEGAPVSGSGIAGIHKWAIYDNTFTETLSMSLLGQEAMWLLNAQGAKVGLLTGVGAFINGALEINGGTAGSASAISIPPQTVTNLNTNFSCGAGMEGARATVNDATLGLTAGIGTTVAGGMGNHVPVYCNGTNWIIG